MIHVKTSTFAIVLSEHRIIIICENKLLFEAIQLFKNYPKTILNKMQTHSLKGFSNFNKQALLNTYDENCSNLNCFACMGYG